ncbi:SGNH hydrolase-type esterase domain-containing protein [Aspergillus oleicola]
MLFWHILCTFALVAQQALAYPLRFAHHVTRNEVDSSDSKKEALSVSRLRVLPLGASITYGTGSSDNNGYRKALRESMTSAGFEVDMVGSRQSGTMKDNENEGWPGYTIARVHEKAKAQYSVKPNLVLINAGTNDCNRNQQEAIDHGASRMEDMVRDIFRNIPDVTIVLSGLLPNNNHDKCTKSLNDQYGRIADRLAKDGENIVFANLHNGQLTLDDLGDGTHPTDAGYKKMAGVWWQAVTAASQKNFLNEPQPNGRQGGETKGVREKNPARYYPLRGAHANCNQVDTPVRTVKESIHSLDVSNSTSAGISRHQQHPPPAECVNKQQDDMADYCCSNEYDYVQDNHLMLLH